jgi:hypothetical protein
MFFRSVSDAFSWSTRASRSAKAQEYMSDYCKVPSISTRQDDCRIPLFFWHNDLFFRTKSSLFACISCTSLWYWAKAQSSLDCNMVECFLALLSSFSSDSARSTVSPYPWSMSDFCRGLSTTSCRRQQSLLSTQFLWNLTTQGYCHVPSSTAQPGASTPSYGPPTPG